MSDFVSNGWALFVAGITVASLVFCLLILIGAARHKVIRDAQGNIQQSTGHVWDEDLRELNNPLPRWWMVLFLITVFFSIAYLVMYPGMGSNKGTLNWSAVGQYEDEIKKAKATEDEVYGAFKTASVQDLAADPKARAIGERLFLNDWLHGGSPEKIIETITEGRRGQMPVMAPAVGSPEEVRQVANYVLSLSGSAHNNVAAELGRAKFAVCAACHGADGKGNQALGAPNLTDKIWLHGWGEGAIVDMVTKGKLNVMPPQIKVLASYVWGLSHPTQTAQTQEPAATAKQ